MLTLYDNYPARGIGQTKHDGFYGSNATVIAQSDGPALCNSVIADLNVGTYWLHVEGNRSVTNGTVVPAEGTFELVVLCMDLPVTPAPTPILSPCLYDYITCDDTIMASTIGKPDIQGNYSGDALYLLTLFGPTSVYMTTCTKFTDFEAQITVYDEFPRPGHMTEFIDVTPKSKWESTWDPRQKCSHVNIDFTEVISYLHCIFQLVL